MTFVSHSPSEWKTALGHVRRIEAQPPGSGGREQAIGFARAMFEAATDPRLANLARLLVPGLSPRGLLAVSVPVERVAARARVTDADMGITGEDRPNRTPFPMVVVADNLRSALNVGGLFRTADAVGAEALWLCGYSATPGCPQVDRSALGAQDAVPWRQWGDVREAIAELRTQGTAVYALETSTQAHPVEHHDFTFPCALLVGNERFGLDPDVAADADALLRIDTFGTKNSLNVVAALAVAGFAARWHWNETERLT